MSVHSRPSIQYQDEMELGDRKIAKDCKKTLRIGRIRVLNVCAGRSFGAATHIITTKTLVIKVIENNEQELMQKPNPALKTKMEYK